MIDTRTAAAEALYGLPARSREIAAETLERAAHWADLHVPVCQQDRAIGTATADGRAWCWCQGSTSTDGRGRRQCCWPGSDGTPAVTVSAVAELGVLLQTTTTSASMLLGDALDLRHRHPRLWVRVMAAEVADWQARKVARLSSELTWERAQQVDEATADLIGAVPWGRALSAVEAAVHRADPELHEQRRLAAEQRRYVSAGRYRGTNSFGLRTMVAQGPVGDIARVDALLDHLARLLKQYGDLDTLEVRRSKAFGLLANPALVCTLLAAARDAQQDSRQHAGQDDAQSTKSDTESATKSDAESGTGRTPALADVDERGEPAEDEATPPPADPHDVFGPSAVELAETFGRVLARYRGGEAWRRLRPPLSMVLHLSDTTLAQATVCNDCGSVGSMAEESAVVRLEDTHGPLGPISLSQLRDLLDDQLPRRLAHLLRAGSSEPRTTGSNSGPTAPASQRAGTHASPELGRPPDDPGGRPPESCRGGPPDDLGLRDQIVVRPVLDPLGQLPVDAYEPPPDMREAVELSAPFEVFPWGTAPSVVCDLDHTETYRDPTGGDPPSGQTRPGNLGPLSRRHHNLKTHHGWRCFQPLPGLFLWLTPSGYWYRVDHLGTTSLGRDEPAVLRQRRPSATTQQDQVPGSADRAAPDLTRSRFEMYLSDLLLRVA